MVETAAVFMLAMALLAAAVLEVDEFQWEEGKLKAGGASGYEQEAASQHLAAVEQQVFVVQMVAVRQQGAVGLQAVVGLRVAAEVTVATAPDAATATLTTRSVGLEVLQITRHCTLGISKIRRNPGIGVVYHTTPHDTNQSCFLGSADPV